MSNTSTARRLAALIEPDLRAAGVDLEDVEVVAAGKRRLVRVLVDKDDGVSLDDVALVSQQISGVLDANPDADAILGSAAYVLEVSSEAGESFTAKVRDKFWIAGLRPKEGDEGVPVRFDGASKRTVFDLTGDPRYDVEAMNARTAEVRAETRAMRKRR